MSTFAFLVLCVQACLFQNVYSCPAKSSTCAPACVPACAPACTPVYAAPACTPVYAAPACAPVYAAPAPVAPCACAVSIPSSCGCGGRYY